jgi:branched-chain amino acid aminotransferase
MIYIDGRFYEKEEAKISVYDHGLLYGDGVFEGIRVYGGRAFRLAEHLERLYHSAKAIMLEIPLSMEEMEGAVNESVRVSGKRDGYIRLIVTRGVGNLGLNPAQCRKASVIIIVDDIQLYPAEYYKKGISVMTSSLRRVSLDCLDPRIKSLNYLNNILARMEAQRAGCLEAVILNREGYVAECSGDNVFVVREGGLFTPSAEYGALDGITKRIVIGIAHDLGIKTIEGALAQYDLYTADECFLTGTGAEIMPVISIDGRVIGDGMPGLLTKQLMDSFRVEIEKSLFSARGETGKIRC